MLSLVESFGVPIDNHAGTSLHNDLVSQFSISGRVIGEERAAIPSEPSNRQGDLSHTRYSRVQKRYDSFGTTHHNIVRRVT